MFFIRINLHKLYPALSFFLVLALIAVPIVLTVNEKGGKTAIQTVATEKSVTIVLDAGHGGEDSGSIGANGVYEKDLNLKMTNLIGQKLEEQGYIIVYTRKEDVLVISEDENVKGLRKISDLKNRCAVAKEHPDAYFVSIHMNSFTSTSCTGLQTYYSDMNEKSEAFAQTLQSEVKSRLQNENKREIKKGTDIYVLEHITSPAILIECGFLSNPKECEKLCDEDYQNELSFAIVCGIVKYISQS